jgi:molecular chaperone DnaJ
MTRLRGGARGDLFVHIQVEVPSRLSREEEALLRKFAELRGDELGAGEIKRGNDSGFFSKFREAFKN